MLRACEQRGCIVLPTTSQAELFSSKSYVALRQFQPFMLPTTIVNLQSVSSLPAGYILKSTYRSGGLCQLRYGHVIDQYKVVQSQLGIQDVIMQSWCPAFRVRPEVRVFMNYTKVLCLCGTLCTSGKVYAETHLESFYTNRQIRVFREFATLIMQILLELPQFRGQTSLGIFRVDCIVDDKGRILLNEIEDMGNIFMFPEIYDPCNDIIVNLASEVLANMSVLK